MKMTVPKDQKDGKTACSDSCAIPGVTLLYTIRVHSIENLISRRKKMDERNSSLNFHIKIVPKLYVFIEKIDSNVTNERTKINQQDQFIKIKNVPYLIPVADLQVNYVAYIINI